MEQDCVLPQRGVPITSGGPVPRIKTRGGPRQLVRLVKALNEQQSRDVCEIGMGGLLGLRVTELPLRLGRWLVSNFDPSQMAINVCDGSYIQITNEDVAAVLGLPNGTVPIYERDSQVVGHDLHAWRVKVNKRKGNITVKALVTHLLTLKDGGVWFKRHFCVVVVSSLIASVSNGYANQRTVHMFREVNKIKDLDWCGYLLRSLVATRRCWVQDKSRKFMGPLLFLTLLYMDRLTVGLRDVPRSIPVFVGWTTQCVKAREAREVLAQGFGSGHLDPPLRATDPNVGSTSVIMGCPNPREAPKPTRGQALLGARPSMVCSRELWGAC
nr:uncharacterized protein LOC109150699 isoform X5 [Ipomoea batatas]